MQQREPSASESYFWPSVWAIALHVLVFGMLFVSFAMTPELPPAKPIVQATLYQLKSKSQATTQTNQKIAGEAKKTASRQTEEEQMEQKKDLSMALDQLLSDIRDGKKYMKVYKQMKMYNDPSTNPILYQKK